MEFPMETPEDLERAKLLAEGEGITMLGASRCGKTISLPDRNGVGDVVVGSRWKSRFHGGMVTVVALEGEHVVYENDGKDEGRYRQRLTTSAGAPGFLFAWRRVED